MTSTIERKTTPKGKLIRSDIILFFAIALDLFLFSDIAAPTHVAGAPHSSPWLLISYACVGYLLLLLRKRADFLILSVLCVYSAAGGLLLSYSPIVAVLIALATVVSRRTLPWRIAAVTVVALTSMTWVYGENGNNGYDFPWITIIYVQIGYLVIVAVATGIGWWIHLNERRSQERRKEAARAAVMAERQHLARELHDIVAHAVTLMVLQASGARAVMADDPVRASDALQVVEKTGTQAMAELRRLLGVLRSVPDGDSDIGSISLPPGLDELPELVEAVSSAGVNVSLHTEGQPHPIDRSVDAAAYRVVSESLTNVTKHSGVGATVEVEVTWSTTHLTIDVRDDGAGAGPDERLSTGNGLLGLTERVVLVGGSFEARPRTTGGYEVHASLPLPAGDQAQPSPARAG